ncbi:hypothetical protein [Sorangium sp. So ce542]|uniref:hypothetical protein n=1 Tax=Sorangium sp. So ce542 TaxID=3133316 RepID=UPI003F60E71C
MPLRKFSSRRLSLIGSTLPLWGSRLNPYRYDAHADFLSYTLGIRGGTKGIKPAQIVTSLNDNRELLKGVADFSRNFVERILETHPEYKRDSKDWSLEERRNVTVQKKTDADGHYIYSGALEPNRRPEMVKSFNAALHFISTFPAGGGFLIERDLFLESIADGRARKRFPAIVFDQNADRIRDYNRRVYKENRSLAGEIVILGNNAVEIKDHVIVERSGATVQIVRPVTMGNHVFYDGHAIWVSMLLPDFPIGTSHLYIGHGKSDVSLAINLGDRLNTASGVPTFKDVFRAGVISYEGLAKLVEQYGDKAYSLSLDPDVALAVDQLLAATDPALIWDRKVLTLLDNTWIADQIRLRNPYTPSKCFGPKDFMLAAAPEAPAEGGDGDCDVTEIDLDDFVKSTADNPLDTMESLEAAVDKYPVTPSGDEGLFQADGKPFDVDGYNEMLSLTRTSADDVYLQDVGDLLGAPVDDYIAELIKRSLAGAVDWSDVQGKMDDAIAEQVKALVEATEPFADGSSSGSVADRFDTLEFRAGIRDRLRTTLTEALGPRSAAFHDLVLGDALFRSASPAVKAMMKDYPFVDGVANLIFSALSAVDEQGTSYLDAQLRAHVIQEKQAYFEDPAQKSAAQERIAERVEALGDVSNLDRELATTGQEIVASRSELASINERLLETPDDKALQDQRDALQGAIDKNIERERELERQQQQRDELERAGEDTDPERLEKERRSAEHDAEISGERAFGE